MSEKISSVVKWQEKDGVITFSVASDGTAGRKWITRLENKEFRVSNHAKRLLTSKYFKPTDGVTSQINILKGQFFKDEDRFTKNIRSEARKRNFTEPNPEVACLIREYLSDEDIKAMGLDWLIIMHVPIKDPSDDFLSLFDVRPLDDGGALCVYDGAPSLRWYEEAGFVFVSAPVDR